jgi:hypothetical protein
MVPLALQTGPPTYQPQLSPFPPTRTGDTFEDTFNGAPSSDDTEKLRSIYGLDQPSNLLPFSLILLIGLVVAAGAYVTFKKRLT